MDERGLPSPIGPQQAEKFSFIDLEIYPFESLNYSFMLSPARSIGFCKIPNFDDRGHFYSISLKEIVILKFVPMAKIPYLTLFKHFTPKSFDSLSDFPQNIAQLTTPRIGTIKESKNPVVRHLALSLAKGAQ